MGNSSNLNLEQRKSLSLFFNNVAVGWFISGIIAPSLIREFDPLTPLKVIVNILSALYLSLVLVKEE